MTTIQLLQLQAQLFPEFCFSPHPLCSWSKQLLRGF